MTTGIRERAEYRDSPAWAWLKGEYEQFERYINCPDDCLLSGYDIRQGCWECESRNREGPPYFGGICPDYHEPRGRRCRGCGWEGTEKECGFGHNDFYCPVCKTENLAVLAEDGTISHYEDVLNAYTSGAISYEEYALYNEAILVSDLLK